MLHEVTLQVQPIQNTQSAHSHSHTHSHIQFQIGNMKLLLLSILDLKLKDVMFYIKKIIKISSDHKGDTQCITIIAVYVVLVQFIRSLKQNHREASVSRSCQSIGIIYSNWQAQS